MILYLARFEGTAVAMGQGLQVASILVAHWQRVFRMNHRPNWSTAVEMSINCASHIGAGVQLSMLRRKTSGLWMLARQSDVRKFGSLPWSSSCESRFVISFVPIALHLDLSKTQVSHLRKYRCKGMSRKPPQSCR